MERIGNICRTFFLLISLLSIYTLGFGQAPPKVEATVSQSSVFTGERVKLNISISGDFSKVNRPSLPDFDDFRLLNATPSTSRSISYVNGVTKSSYTYSYYLQPKGAGKAEIPPVSVTVDGKDYQTDRIHIQVTDHKGGAKNGSADDQSDIFMQLHVTNAHPVTGEQVIANVVLYFKKGLEVRSYQPVPGWKAEGFWKERLKSAGHPKVKSTILNGVRYRSARLVQLALFPTKSGKLTISPYKIQVAIRSTSRSDDPFGSFFGGFGNNQRQIELKTKPVSVDVDTLPPTDNENYIGAVGNFKINRKIKTTQAEVGQSIEVETDIRGTGNIPLINKPSYQFPSGLEVYQPEEDSNINRGGHYISGRKMYTDVVVARAPGTFTIPAAKLAYYNPNSKKYITQTLPAKTITVKPNPNAQATTGNSQSFSLQPITGLAEWISPTAQPLYSYWWLWAGLILPAIAVGLVYWRKSYQDRMMSDAHFARAQKSTQKAEERLKEALNHADDGRIKEAYNALQKALTGFIGDRLGLPEAGLSIEQYVAALQEHAVDDDLIKNVRMLLNKCATINYAPDSSQDYLKSHVGLAESIIKKLRKEL